MFHVFSKRAHLPSKKQMYCPEIPGANGQGKTIEEAEQSLADAVDLILEDRREE